MAKKEVTVVINGQESVSTATESAGAGLTLFGKKIPFVIDATKLLEMGLSALKAAFGAAKDFVLNSIEAYDKFSASQRKLEGTAKLSGIALGTLKDIAETGQKAFGLAAGTSNEFASEIGKLTSKSGDITKSKDAMAAFLDIGAARGLSAADTLKAVQQAVLGIDEGTDKLFGKNPSVLYQEYADKIGISAGKLTDQQKSQALLDATLIGGEAVRGAYLDYLNSAAGQQEQANQKIEQAQVAFGAAIQPIRTLVLQGLNKLLEVLIPVAEWLGKTANTAGVTIVQAFNAMKEKVGEAAMVLGRITGNRALEEWGTRTAVAAGEAIRAVDATVQKASQGTKTATDAVQQAHVQTTAVTKAEVDKQNKELERQHKLWLDTMKMLYDGALTTTEVMKRLAPEVRKSFEPERIKTFNDVMDKSRQLGDELMEKMKGVKIDPPQLSTVEKLKLELKGSADELVGVARGALDLAQSFGVVDRTTASALTSVVNLGQAVGKLAGGDLFSGVSGILGGVANIVSTMMAGDTERRRLLAQNNTALERLRKDIGGLNLRISGDTLISAQTALAGVVGNLRGGRGAANENDVRNALYAQGLSMEDFDRIAKEFGIEVRTKSGALNVDSVKAVFEAIKTVQLGKVGNDFQSQLDFFQQGQDIGNEQGAGRATNLLRFLQEKGGVGALAGLDLSNPAKLREQLIALRGQLNSAEGIDETQLGKLSGGQFNDLLVSILGMLNTGTPSGGGDVTVPTGGGGGTTSVPSETIQSVIKAMDNNLASILTSHTVIHERIAVATEGSYSELRTLNGKMDQLIAVSAGTDRIDAALEAERRLLAVQQGTPVAF
jgi:hypothetical protein